MSNSEIAPTHNSAVEQIGSLKSGTALFSTINGDTFEGKKATLAALTNAEPLADHLGETINLANAVFQAVTLTDAVTGEVTDAVRTIIIDSSGVAYAAVSSGLFGSLRDIFGIMGEPATWNEPLPIIVSEQKGNKGFKFFKVALA